MVGSVEGTANHRSLLVFWAAVEAHCGLELRISAKVTLVAPGFERQFPPVGAARTSGFGLR